jgi:hypothetical protein
VLEISLRLILGSISISLLLPVPSVWVLIMTAFGPNSAAISVAVTSVWCLVILDFGPSLVVISDPIIGEATFWFYEVAVSLRRLGKK